MLGEVSVSINAIPHPNKSNLARFAKSNAFVMLVGLNGNAYMLSLAERDFVK
jgi:hypothetical protein